MLWVSLLTMRLQKTYTYLPWHIVEDTVRTQVAGAIDNSYSTSVYRVKSQSLMGNTAYR